MSYFNGFPEITYKFGNEVDDALFQNLSAYVDIIDQVKDDASFYIKYNIREGERPDILSQKLYGDPRYYWTFYALNDNIKERGWPVDNDELVKFVKNKYPNTTLVTRDYFFTTFRIGDTIEGVTSGTTATVIDRDVNLGSIVVEGTKTFTAGETIRVTNVTPNPTVILHSYSEEYNSARFYEDATGERVDVDPTIGPGAELVEITQLEYYTRLNEENRAIRVLRPDNVSQIFAAFKTSLREIE